MTENVVGNFYLNWTFLTFYFITLDLRKRYSEHRDNNQNIFEIINQLMIIQTLKQKSLRCRYFIQSHERILPYLFVKFKKHLRNNQKQLQSWLFSPSLFHDHSNRNIILILINFFFKFNPLVPCTHTILREGEEEESFFSTSVLSFSSWS